MELIVSRGERESERRQEGVIIKQKQEGDLHGDGTVLCLGGRGYVSLHV